MVRLPFSAREEGAAQHVAKHLAEKSCREILPGILTILPGLLAAIVDEPTDRQKPPPKAAFV
jgi:hypothetical protein